MTITELVKELEAVKKGFGDLEVEITYERELNQGPSLMVASERVEGKRVLLLNA